MNRAKSTSSLLLLATMLGAVAPLRADYGTELLPHMYVGSPATTIEHAHKLPLSEKLALRQAIVERNAAEVARLLPLHEVNPRDLMKFLEHVATDVRKGERWKAVGRQAGLGLFTLVAFIGAAASNDRRTSAAFGSFIMPLLAVGGLNLGGLFAKEGLFNGLRKLPKQNVENMNFLELRGYRQTIANDLVAELGHWFLVNNRKFVDRAALALQVEAAYSKKQLMVGAIAGAVVLAAAVLYLAASAVRRNTQAKAATIGAGVLGGLAGLLSLSPFASPMINERLKRLQSKYSESLAQVNGAGK